MGPEPVQAQIEKILASKAFAQSEQLRAFLRFTVEKTLAGEATQIKEYVLGVEVFNRGEAFDPREDNIVRTQAGKLRARLEKYYAEEGRDDAILIEYPKGGYVPVFRPRDTAIPPAPEPAPSRAILGRKVLWAAAGALVLVAVASYLFGSRHRTEPETGIPSVAVLPFVDMSAEKDQGYFCDGITEELINSLAQIDGLRVVARTSAFEFKEKARDIRKIGEQLNVRAVVEGSVRKTGNKLRLTVQLNSVADGYHLWSKTYDRELKDLFAIQEETSEAIARTLSVKLAGHPAGRAGDPEVHDLYLQGRYHLNTTTPEGVKLALDSFQRALARDPAYAPALAGLAEAYYWMPMRSGMPMREALPKAKEAAQKALAIDERLPEAHSSMALALFSYDWDWPAAEREFKRALELNANHAAVHLAYSRYLTSMGRTDEAVREVRRAVDLDPLSTSVRRQLAVVLVLRREFDACIDECKRMIALDPAFYLAYTTMGTALIGKKQYAEAIEALQQGWTLSAHRDPMALAWLGTGLAAKGDQAKAEEVLAEVLAMAKKGYVRPAYIALLCAMVGKDDEAFAWLDRSYAERDVNLTYMPLEFRWDRIRSDPRFIAAVKRLGLP